MNPQNANPGNFKVQSIIYTSPDGYFSIAKGTWTEDEQERLAMRWNGDIEDPNDKGYPSVFQNPMWFQLPYDITGVLDALKEVNEPNYGSNEKVKLTLSIQNTQPVHLVDLIEMFTGIDKEYRRFISKNGNSKTARSLRLHMNRVRSGSQIFELIALTPLVLQGIGDLNTVFEFAEHLKKIFNQLLGNSDKKKSEFEKE
ncbi:MAG TPA: hypothetical protein VGD31_05225, partial [Sphingobacteriaceae bacterium]